MQHLFSEFSVYKDSVYKDSAYNLDGREADHMTGSNEVH